MTKEKTLIVSPANGAAVPLDQIPDTVFAERMLGEGIAVVPVDGKFVSPVDGEVVSVADSSHAIGFQTKDGLEVMMHIGLDTVQLNGEGFQVYVKEGDTVKKGDLVTEVDFKLLEKNGINPIIPVVICNGLVGKKLECFSGIVKAAKSVIFKVGAA